MEFDAIVCADALEYLRTLPDESVHLIATDPPYNITACEWETEVNLDDLWSETKRILVGDGVVIMTASQPFTSRVVMSNPAWFRYEWIWSKSQGTGYLNANRVPMKSHENVLVFYRKGGRYIPQLRNGLPYSATRGAVGGFVRDKTVGGYLTVNNGFRYPKSVLEFEAESGLHPTQKPIALFEYLIRTYSEPGELICDPFIGSGTTAVAARNLGRHYVGCDLSAEYVALARERLRLPFEAHHVPPPDFAPPADRDYGNGEVQLALWSGANG